MRRPGTSAPLAVALADHGPARRSEKPPRVVVVSVHWERTVVTSERTVVMSSERVGIE